MSVRQLAAAILVGALGSSMLLRGSVDHAAASTGSEPVVYVHSGETLCRFSFGYEGLLADLYWTRAVQYFGRERLSGNSRFGQLDSLLRTAVTLDPHLLIAYRFGAIFLAEKPPAGAGEAEAALALIRRGIVANPGYWRLWQDLGFIYYWDLKDYQRAATAFEAGSRQPGAGVWMKTLAASVAAQGGELDTSRLLWTQVLREAGNEAILGGAIEHLAAIQATEELAGIDNRLSLFEHRTGRRATRLDDLVSAGILAELPVDPTGVPYILAEDGKAAIGPASGIDLALARQ